jgi:hypothetical protein
MQALRRLFFVSNSLFLKVFQKSPKNSWSQAFGFAPGSAPTYAAEHGFV